jgi:peptidoglycan/xylan/chitin deacetylase (PgdA/CDA1 family)
LEEFVRRLDDGSLPANAVAVTFDDGYCDNLYNAKPLLVAAGVPATVFLATGFIGRSREYWWDELASLLLLAPGPDTLTCSIGREKFNFKFEALQREGDNRPWHGWEEPVTERQAAYIAIWHALRSLPESRREIVLTELRSKLVRESVRYDEPGRPMSRSEVKELIDGDLIKIGAHTVTHPSLPGLDRVARESELLDSKEACQDLAGRPISSFAYPYGDVDAEVRKQVEEIGFSYAVSTVRAYIKSESDRFALPRIHVANWDSDAFGTALHSI